MLETDRLILRPFVKEDLDDFFEYAQMEEIGPYCGWAAIKDKDIALERLNRMISIDNYFAIVLKSEDKVIGSIVLSNPDKKRYPNIDIEDNVKELGCNLSKYYWSNGYMTEAVNEMMRYAFEDLGVSAIYALSASPNINSAKLQDRCGFNIVGEIPNKTWIDGSKMSLIQRKISADEYYGKNKIIK